MTEKQKTKQGSWNNPKVPMCSGSRSSGLWREILRHDGHTLFETGVRSPAPTHIR